MVQPCNRLVRSIGLTVTRPRKTAAVANWRRPPRDYGVKFIPLTHPQSELLVCEVWRANASRSAGSFVSSNGVRMTVPPWAVVSIAFFLANTVMAVAAAARGHPSLPRQ